MQPQSRPDAPCGSDAHALAAAEASVRRRLRRRPEDPGLNAELGLLLCYQLRESEAVPLLDKSRGARQHRRLCQIVIDHLQSRCLLAAKTGIPDRKAAELLSTLTDQTGVQPGDVGVTLTACLIVRDEQDNLPRCLSSLQGVADEIVVVDTGSTDDTVRIAESYGAKVGHFTWCDDFAAARNASLDLATGDWILWIDADEQVAPEGGRETLHAGLVRPHFGGHCLLVSNILDGDRGANVYLFKPVRLFRRLPEVRFRHRIHEQVLEALGELGLSVAVLPGPGLNHYGYSPEQVQAKDKQARNLRMLRREVEDEPQNAFQWYNLAAAYAMAGMSEQAVEACRQSARFTDYSSSGYMTFIAPNFHLLAQELTKTGRPAEALEVCDEADRRGYGGLQTEFHRAAALLAAKRPEEALAAAERCIAARWGEDAQGDYSIVSFRRYALKGMILVEMERYEEALPELQRALQVVPDDPATQLLMAVALRKMARLDEALGYLGSCFDAEREGVTALALAAGLHREAGRTAKAVETYQQYWDRGGRDPSAVLEWATTCRDLGEPERMIPAFEYMAAAGHLTTTMLTYWADAFEKQQQPEKALRCLVAVIEHTPADPRAYFNCADLMFRLQAYADAAGVYRQGLRFQPDNAQAWLQTGTCMYRAGSLHGARTCFEQALRLEPGSIEVRNNLAHVTRLQTEIEVATLV